jgi:exonuclease VII small subunit
MLRKEIDTAMAKLEQALGAYPDGVALVEPRLSEAIAALKAVSAELSA